MMGKFFSWLFGIFLFLLVFSIIFWKEYLWKIICTFFSGEYIQIDPFSFLGTLLIGFVSGVFIWKQVKIAKTALEQNRPILKMQSSKQFGTEAPHILLFNEGQAEAINIFIAYKKSENQEWKVIDNWSNIGVDLDSKYLIELHPTGENDDTREMYYSVIIFYTNVLSERNYLYAKNLNFNNSANDSLFEIGIPSENMDTTLISPLSQKDWGYVVKKFSKYIYRKINISNVWKILKASSL